MISTQLQSILKENGAYRLRPFVPILEKILSHYGSLTVLRDKDVLELGPGVRVDMMRFLQNVMGVRSISGTGSAVYWPWTQQRAFIRQHIVNQCFLEFFGSHRRAQYDLIYSRLVFEQHSIDPWRLLTGGAYWRQFKKMDFREFDETYPASIPNLRAVFKAAWKTLRPGGIIVSFVGKRKYTALDPAFLEGLRPSHYNIEEVGPLSAVITVKR
ncbi:hypothetical protein ACFL6U_21395 [Planctomycetota bacterium]